MDTIPDKITLAEVISLLGEPTAIQGAEHLFQCVDCLDSGRNNLKYNSQKQVLCCMSDKTHTSVYKKILQIRRNIEKAEKQAPKTNREPISITTEQVKSFNEYLLNSTKTLEFIRDKRGITSDTIKDLKIGFCNGSDVKAKKGWNWVIPIYDINNKLIGSEFRKHDFTNYESMQNKNGYKVFKTEGVGDRLCKVNHNVNAKYAIVLEGFMDAIVFYQWLKGQDIHEDYDIYTSSNGSGCLVRVIKDLPFKKYSKVYLCLDKDKNTDPNKKCIKGKEAEALIIKENSNQEFHIVNFECDCCKDFNDAYLQHSISSKILYEAKKVNEKQNSFVHISKIYEEKVLHRYMHPELYPVIPTGFKSLDARLKGGGLRQEEIVGILARASMGKTNMLISMIKNNIIMGYKVGLVSLEMSADGIIERLQTNFMEFSSKDLEEIFKQDKNKGLSKVKEFRELIPNLPLYICDKNNLSLGSIKEKIFEQFGDKGIDLLYIDHMNLVQADSKDSKGKSLYDKSTEIYNNLIPLRRELGVPIIAACQLNRNVEARQNKRPQLSDIANSGAAEAAFTVALGLYRAYYYDPSLPETANDAEIVVCKNREGEGGIIECKFFGQYSMFRDATELEKNNTAKPEKIKMKKVKEAAWFKGEVDDDDF